MENIAIITILFLIIGISFGVMGHFLNEDKVPYATLTAIFGIVSFILFILLISKENQKSYSITNNEYQEIEKIEIQGSDTTYYYNIKSK